MKKFIQKIMSLYMCTLSFSHAVKHQPQRNPNYNFAFGVLAALWIQGNKSETA